MLSKSNRNRMLACKFIGVSLETKMAETEMTPRRSFCQDETEKRRWYVSRPSRESRPRPQPCFRHEQCFRPFACGKKTNWCAKGSCPFTYEDISKQSSCITRAVGLPLLSNWPRVKALLCFRAVGL